MGDEQFGDIIGGNKGLIYSRMHSLVQNLRKGSVKPI